MVVSSCVGVCVSSSLQALVLGDKVPGLVTRISVPDTRSRGVGQPKRRHVSDEFVNFPGIFPCVISLGQDQFSC